MENYERLSDMNDLTNSFKFNNNHAFDGFNKKENQKEDSENDSASDEQNTEETSDNSPAPQILDTKKRKVLTDWLDAEYNSAFQYKKINMYCTSEISVCSNNKEKGIDIEDPIVVYEYLKKYTNILYDYNCDKETEKFITNTLEKELKEYFYKNSTEGLEKYLDERFKQLKETFLVIKKEEIPVEKINKMLFVKEFN